MFQNWIASWFAGMAAGKLSGYKTRIFGAATILYIIVAVVGHIWPDLGLPGSNLNWHDMLNQAQAAWPLLVGGAGVGLGVLHKSYKLGVNTKQEDIAALSQALNTAASPAPVIKEPLKEAGV